MHEHLHVRGDIHDCELTARLARDPHPRPLPRLRGRGTEPKENGWERTPILLFRFECGWEAEGERKFARAASIFRTETSGRQQWLPGGSAFTQPATGPVAIGFPACYTVCTTHWIFP